MILSLIIPVYNESAKLHKDVLAADQFFQNHAIKGEIIIVDDGSEDDTREQARNSIFLVNTPVKVLGEKKHKGKGFAVRTGILQSSGTVVMFADSGLCTPFRYILSGTHYLNKECCDIAHGSRKLPGSIIHRPQSRLRRLISFVMGVLFKTLYRIPALTDTQCGFKLYPGELARELYGASQCNGFLFDIEIIMLAYRAGYRICEFPIEWSADPDSRLTPLKSARGIIEELFELDKRQKKL
jgi:dolichyl-phosphate beta-glucosyltransferase